MKTWKILRDCRRKGDGLHHAMLGIARLHSLVHLVDELPTTVTGKVRKVEMRHQAAGLLGLNAESGTEPAWRLPTADCLKPVVAAGGARSPRLSAV